MFHHSLQFHHGDWEVVWDAVARRGLKAEEMASQKDPATAGKDPAKKSKASAKETLAQESACCTVYEEAVGKLSTGGLWAQNVCFHRTLIN